MSGADGAPGRPGHRGWVRGAECAVRFGAERPSRPSARTQDWTRGAGRPGCASGRSRGSATAELAAALPALILLLLFALGAVNAVLAHMQCVDAARSGALVSARGGDGVAEARRTGPAGAEVRLNRNSALVTVRVGVTVHPLGPHLPAVSVDATAVAETEPGVAS